MAGSSHSDRRAKIGGKNCRVSPCSPEINGQRTRTSNLMEIFMEMIIFKMVHMTSDQINPKLKTNDLLFSPYQISKYFKIILGEGMYFNLIRC